MLRYLLPRLLPRNAYEYLRQRYRRYCAARRERLPPLSEAAFRAILTETLGLQRGAVVFVHSSLANMNLGFSAFRALAILEDVVGDEGTLLFPCTHLAERAEDYLRRDEVFDVRRARTTMGALPEVARRRPQAVRSLHPTNSVVALGRLAEELVRAHADSVYPCGRDSPYFKIVEHDGLIAGLGVSTRMLSFVHCVEDVLGPDFPVPTRTEEIFPARVLDWDGQERIIPTRAQTTVTRRLAWRPVPRFLRQYVSPEICRDLQLAGVEFFVARARPLYARLEELAAHGMTIYGRVGTPGARGVFRNLFRRPAASSAAPVPASLLPPQGAA